MAYTTIKKPSDYFNTKLYTGNGGTQSITGVGFQPDWTWIKERSSTSDNCLYDAVRGVTKRLESNTTDPEATAANQLNAFGTDGFTTGDSGATNENSQTYASWNWKAGTTSGLSGGTITPSGYSINATSGFGIYKYTGNGTGSATISHGLGTTPNFVIIKRTSAANDWFCWGDGFTRLALNNTNADYGNHDLSLSSTLVTLPSTVDTAWNTSGETYVMYVFSNRTGYSKFGSYIGNASADGPFVYTGFKPAFVIAKLTSVAGENWYLWDNKRSTGNVMDKFLYPNLSNAEVSSTSFIDFLSNGFKLRSSSDVLNGSGNTQIYMAFAEEPLVGDNPATAR